MTLLQWFFLLAALLVTYRAAQAEPYKLTLVRMDTPGTIKIGNTNQYVPESRQYFSMQVGRGIPTQFFEKNFKQIVKKEPEKYVSEHPMRSVAKLGSKEYGFVFDKKDEKSKGYDRLYFDINGNGDLTDDAPIDASKVDQPNIASDTPVEYVQSQFPRVDLTIDVDGKPLDYSFFFRVFWQRSSNFEYASANLTAGVYRSGEVTIDGKKIVIDVFDYNANGRFDDLTSLAGNMRGAQGELYPQYGDVLLIDPQDTSGSNSNSYGLSNERQTYLAKLNAIGNKFYEIKVSPTGDELSLSSSAAAVGQIVNPNTDCKVELMSDNGYLAMKLEKSKPVPIPAGKWKLLSYDISISNWKPQEEKEGGETSRMDEKQTSAKPSLFDVMSKAIKGTASQAAEFTPMYGPQNLSMISARGTNSCEPIDVQADQSTTLKFGPPYKTAVKANYNPGTANLELLILGSQGEVVSNLYVNGRRPPKPELTITDAKGEIVQTGNFEYG